MNLFEAETLFLRKRRLRSSPNDEDEDFATLKEGPKEPALGEPKGTQWREGASLWSKAHSDRASSSRSAFGKPRDGPRASPFPLNSTSTSSGSSVSIHAASWVPVFYCTVLVLINNPVV